MKIEVPHSEDSQKYIDDTFGVYTEVYEPITKVKGSCIIHLYPKEDTMINGEDNLTGYMDAYLCDMHVYDCENNIVYKHKYSDAVYSDMGCQIKVFKDLSTMIMFNRGCSINYGSATFVNKGDD